MRSIRRRLLVTLLVGFGGAALIVGSLALARMSDALGRQFDATLRAKANALLAMLEVDDGYLEFNYAPEMHPEFERAPSPDGARADGPADDGFGPAEYFEFRLNDAPIRRSRSLGDGDLPGDVGPFDAPRYFDVDLPDGRPGRAIGVAAVVDWGDEPEADEDDGGPADADADGDGDGEGHELGRVPEVRLVVARGRGPLDEALAASRHALVLAGAVLAALVAAVVLVGVTRGLRPLRDLADEVDRISAATLHTRVPDAALPVELRSVANKLNELLERLDGAFRRERRLTADIAHELRTPIAELRSAADVALRWPDDQALAREAIRAAQEISRRMGALIDGLLRLARVAANEAAVREDELELATLTRELCASHEATATRRRVTLCCHLADARVRSDPDLAAHAIGNLIENAVSHAPAGTAVDLRLSVDDDAFRLQIENAAPALAHEDLAHLTEPFWQKDAARADGTHSGLGLALVASIVKALRWRIGFTLDDRALRVTVTGPIATGADAGGPDGEAAKRRSGLSGCDVSRRVRSR